MGEKQTDKEKRNTVQGTEEIVEYFLRDYLNRLIKGLQSNT